MADKNDLRGNLGIRLNGIAAADEVLAPLQPYRLPALHQSEFAVRRINRDLPKWHLLKIRPVRAGRLQSQRFELSRDIAGCNLLPACSGAASLQQVVG